MHVSKLQLPDPAPSPIATPRSKSTPRMGTVTSAASEDYALDTVERLSLQRNAVNAVQQEAKERMKKERQLAKDRRTSSGNLLRKIDQERRGMALSEQYDNDDREDEPAIFYGKTQEEQLANYKKGKTGDLMCKVPGKLAEHEHIIRIAPCWVPPSP